MRALAELAQVPSMSHGITLDDAVSAIAKELRCYLQGLSYNDVLGKARFMWFVLKIIRWMGWWQFPFCWSHTNNVKNVKNNGKWLVIHLFGTRQRYRSHISCVVILLG